MKRIVGMARAWSVGLGLAWAGCGSAGASGASPRSPVSEMGYHRADPPPLPAPVSNNAVAAVETSRGWAVFSLLGLDATKEWDGVTTASYRWNLDEPAWREISPPPGPGRLAATAQAVRGRVYLFGGYTVAEDGTERSVPAVDVLDPETEAWSSAAPIPVPVDDAVSGVWRDSLIYLVSGWHDRDNEAAVQIYDPATDRWRQATPIPGPPVFGHTGAIVGDAIVYVDGVRVDRDPRAFALERSSWIGRIDPQDPSAIEWARLPDHPGPGVYRGAAVGLPERVLFAGGSDNPYNYSGIGYDGRPSGPSARSFGFDVVAQRWVELGDLDLASMDHRALVRADRWVYVVGGMTAGQRVTDRVAVVSEVRGPRR